MTTEHVNDIELAHTVLREIQRTLCAHGRMLIHGPEMISIAPIVPEGKHSCDLNVKLTEELAEQVMNIVSAHDCILIHQKNPTPGFACLGRLKEGRPDHPIAWFQSISDRPIRWRSYPDGALMVTKNEADGGL